MRVSIIILLCSNWLVCQSQYSYRDLNLRVKKVKFNALESSFKGEKDALKKILIVADSLFSIDDYQKALTLYKRVIRLDPKNDYAKDKIFEINILLINLENEANEVVQVKNSTAEIIQRAKYIQEQRIENFRNKATLRYDSNSR